MLTPTSNFRVFLHFPQRRHPLRHPAFAHTTKSRIFEGLRPFIRLTLSQTQLLRHFPLWCGRHLTSALSSMAHAYLVLHPPLTIAELGTRSVCCTPCAHGMARHAAIALLGFSTSDIRGETCDFAPLVARYPLRLKLSVVVA